MSDDDMDDVFDYIQGQLEGYDVQYFDTYDQIFKYLKMCIHDFGINPNYSISQAKLDEIRDEITQSMYWKTIR